MLSYMRTYNVAKTARERLRKTYKWNTDSIEIVVDDTARYSECELDGDTLEITLGKYRGETKDSVFGVLYHEFGHAFLFAAWDLFDKRTKAQFRALFGSPNRMERGVLFAQAIDFIGLSFVFPNFISAYARTSPHEDFAETFSAYMQDVACENEVLKAKLNFVEGVLKKYARRL